MVKVRAMMVSLMATMLLTACAGSSNLVVEPNRSNFRSQSVTLEYADATVDVEQESVDELQRYMREEFYGTDRLDSVFAEGEGLRIRYGYVSFDEGSQASRYFLPIVGGGEAHMVVRAQFLDSSGNSLAIIQSEGRLGGGFFGGDAGSAIRGAAREIADYAKSNFAPEVADTD